MGRAYRLAQTSQPQTIADPQGQAQLQEAHAPGSAGKPAEKACLSYVIGAVFPSLEENAMHEFSISKLKDFDLSQDGRKAILNFDIEGCRLALKITALDLEALSHEIGFVLTKARELSNHDVVPFLRPARCRADLLSEGSTVVTVYQLPSGIEHRYGLEPNVADGLARQMIDAVQRGKTAKSPTSH